MFGLLIRGHIYICHIFRLKYRCSVYVLSMIVPSLYRSYPISHTLYRIPYIVYPISYTYIVYPISYTYIVYPKKFPNFQIFLNFIKFLIFQKKNHKLNFFLNLRNFKISKISKFHKISKLKKKLKNSKIFKIFIKYM